MPHFFVIVLLYIQSGVATINGFNDDAYIDASNYYRLNGKTLVDIRGLSRVKMTPRAFNVTRTKQLGHVISLNGRDESIQIQGLTHNCIANPEKCSNGLSLGFWLRMKGGKYIMSGGSFGDKSHGSGFKIYRDINSSNFNVLIATASKKWTAIIHKIPFHNQWFHFLFTWSVTVGLKVYINGAFVLDGVRYQHVEISTDNSEVFDGIIIAKPDKFEHLFDFGHFDIGHIAIWKHRLTTAEISKAYKTSIRVNEEIKRCCERKAASPCVRNPCLKFKKPKECESVSTKNDCICPDVKMAGKCNGREIDGACIDRRMDCGILAAQIGYCSYFQQDMERLCPSSCKFCGQKSIEETIPPDLETVTTKKIITTKRVDLTTTQEYKIPKTQETKHSTTEMKPTKTRAIKHPRTDMPTRQETTVKTPNNPYDKSTHYFKMKYNKLVDVRDQRIKTIISSYPSEKATKQTNQLGPVLSLNSIDDYANIRGFRKECVTDPDECLHGLSIGFWLKMVKGKHILSGGSYGEEPRGSGFKIYYHANATQLKVEIATRKKKWMALIHKLPKNWFHFLFSWSRQTGLSIFINGGFVLHKKGSQERTSPFNIDRENDIVLIAKQDSSEQIKQPVQLDIGHLAIWYEMFDDADAIKAYELSVTENTKSRACCFKREKSECLLDPCYKFKKTANCEEKCICPKVVALQRCSPRTFVGECVNKRTDCETLAAQRGYCDFYQKDMETLCPASCGYCVPKKPKMAAHGSRKLKKELVIFLTIGCAAGIILLLLIALYSWKVYRSKFTGAFIPNFKTSTLLESEEYGDEKWTKKYIDSSYFVIKDVPPKKRALPIIPSKPSQPKYQPPEF